MFITASELNSTLYPEIQAAIARNQTTIVELHINEAIGFVESKLATKYAIREEMQKTGNDRHPLLLKYVKDIAVYFLYDLPETIPAKRVKAYDDAVRFLDDCVKGNALLAGVNPAPTENNIVQVFGNISSGSDEKRDRLW